MVYRLIFVLNIKCSKNEKQIQIKRFIMTMIVFKNEKHMLIEYQQNYYYYY